MSLGDGWATGDARNFTPTHDEWNDSTTGVAGHGNEGFNDARTDKDLGDAAASPAGGAGGACFNCGQGKVDNAYLSSMLILFSRRSYQGRMHGATKIHWRMSSMRTNWVSPD